jgi:ankyrin repeat protein
MVGLALVGAACIHAKSMKAADYFEPGSQRALAEVAAKGRTDLIDDLLRHGAQINFQGREGMTALIWAFLQENKDGYEHLLRKRADPNLQMTESTLTSDGLTDGSSAMSLSAMHEDPWYLKATLKHGGNPNIVNPVKSVTPVFQCIMLYDKKHPRLEQLKLLIDAGANLNAQDRDGSTPMRLAAIANRYDLVYVMLASGADPFIKTKAGTTLMSTIKRIRTDPKSELYQWRAKVIDLLKVKGIDIEQYDPGR